MGSIITLCCKRRQHIESQSEAILVIPQKKTEYSWDKERAELNIKDFTIENSKDVTLGRTPGTVNGQQFIIQNCQNCNIYIFDHANTISVDDCSDCRIYLGPVKTSVFLRDCQRCKVAVSCQQFRVRDCTKLDVFLHCVTQPIIESSSAVRFGCLQFYYPELEGQYRDAGLSVYNNNWGKIHDFTQVPDHNNYSILPPDVNIEDYLPLPSSEQFAHMELSTDRKQSVVPLTLGPNKPPSDETCLVVFFNDGHPAERVVSLNEQVAKHHPNISLIQTQEVKISPDKSLKIFGSDVYALAVETGPVIGLQYSGHNVTRHLQERVTDIMKGTTGLVFVSTSPDASQANLFFDAGDMLMSV